MPSDENAEIYSWCPFAGRQNDPRYVECYDPDEEHKPRVFTVRELCNHVYNSHPGMYLNFSKYIKHHIKECLCEKDGRRIVVSSTPLDLTYIKSEFQKFVTEQSTALAKPHSTEEVKVPTSPYPEPEQLIGNIIDNIQQLLQDTPSWTGSMAELHLEISCIICDDRIPTTPRILGKMLTGIKDRLSNLDIRCLRFSAGRVVLQRTVNGKFELISADCKVIKTHTSTPQAKNESHKTTEEPAHTTVTEPDNAKTTSDAAPISTNIYQSGYKLSMELDALPENVREKIEVDFKGGMSITSILHYLNNRIHCEPQIYATTLRAYMERHRITRQLSGRVVKWTRQQDTRVEAAEVVIDSIQQLLSDNPIWMGTSTELHSKLWTNSIFFPASPSRMGYAINRSKERLLNSDIQVSRYQRSEFSKTQQRAFFKGNFQVVIALQRKVDGKFKSFEELCDNLTPKAPDHIVEVAGETIPDAPISSPIVKNHSIEVIGLSILKQSMVEIPGDVISRIGVKDGDRVIFIDDGENIIIKPAIYTT